MSFDPKEENDKQGQSPSEYGAVTEPGTIRLERVMPGPIERVWAYLTEPEKRAKWLASGVMELRVGGRVELKFRHDELSRDRTPPDEYRKFEGCATISGRITRCDPPRLLSYTWDEPGENSEVTFEVTARGGDALLVVTHRRLSNRGKMVSVASGWHAHLGILIDHLNNREPRPFWSTLVRTKAEYEKLLPPEHHVA